MSTIAQQLATAHAVRCTERLVASMLQRRVTRGHARPVSQVRLAELCDRHEGAALAAALVEEGFAGPRIAHRFVEVHALVGQVRA